MQITPMGRARPAVPATAVVVDLRSFTSNLRSAGKDDDGISHYCHYLGAVYGEAMVASQLATPPGDRDDDGVMFTSTGDGCLSVFTGDQHVERAFLMALILGRRLARLCATYNAEHSPIDPTSYGIGLETGSVWPVEGSAGGTTMLSATIGNCINIASRCQDLTRRLYKAHTILGPSINARLVRSLFGEDYRAVQKAAGRSTGDQEYLGTVSQMRELNERLCLTFVHVHRLPGVKRPLPLFRLSESTATLGNPRFEALLEVLTTSPDHLTEVRESLA